jgi:hypothetical protein
VGTGVVRDAGGVVVDVELGLALVEDVVEVVGVSTDGAVIPPVPGSPAHAAEVTSAAISAATGLQCMTHCGLRSLPVHDGGGEAAKSLQHTTVPGETVEVPPGTVATRPGQGA